MQTWYIYVSRTPLKLYSEGKPQVQVYAVTGKNEESIYITHALKARDNPKEGRLAETNSPHRRIALKIREPLRRSSAPEQSVEGKARENHPNKSAHGSRVVIHLQ